MHKRHLYSLRRSEAIHFDLLYLLKVIGGLTNSAFNHSFCGEGKHYKELRLAGELEFRQNKGKINRYYFIEYQ
jgi:hypothetical protein